MWKRGSGWSCSRERASRLFRVVWASSATRRWGVAQDGLVRRDSAGQGSEWQGDGGDAARVPLGIEEAGRGAGRPGGWVRFGRPGGPASRESSSGSLPTAAAKSDRCAATGHLVEEPFESPLVCGRKGSGGGRETRWVNAGGRDGQHQEGVTMRRRRIASRCLRSVGAA